jgi:hypothetical protein
MKLPNFPADRIIAKSGGELTDGFWLFLSNIGAWIRHLQYASPLVSKTQASLAAYALTLTADDANLLVEVTDYAHILRWTGSAWQWGPGETGGGFFSPFAIAPGTGWHACDGSSVAYLKSDGTTANVTVPNTAGSAAYLKPGAAYSATITAATVPTVTAPTFTGTPVTPTGTVSAIAATATTTVLVTSSGAVQVAAQNHTHAAPTFTGAALTPAGTNSVPTASLPGDPVASFPVVLYFRK